MTRCAHCGDSFCAAKGRGRPRKYCSPECSYQANLANSRKGGERRPKLIKPPKVDPPTHCALCGNGLGGPDRQQGRPRKYCSRRCRELANYPHKPKAKPDGYYSPCVGCGEWFEGGNKKQVRCKNGCGIRHTWARTPNKERGPFTCQGCGKDYMTRRSKGEGEKYCSRECAFGDYMAWNSRSDEFVASAFRAHIKAGYRLKPCVLCRTLMVDKPGKRFCSERCGYLHGQRISITPITCRECGVESSPLTGARLFCSAECANRDHRRTRRKRERARLRAAKVETVNPTLVFQRDRWACQLCGRKTPRKLRGTHDPRAPELDHIQPLSQGGEHSYQNTQCACRECNHNKGGEWLGQLRLVG